MARLSLFNKFLPYSGDAQHRRGVLQPTISLFEYGVLSKVFGVDRTDDGVPAFDYRVCAEHPGRPLPVHDGTAVIAPYGLGATVDADLVAVPASLPADTPTPAVNTALRAALDRGAYVLSLCSGAFTLAAAGLLDGRRCTTHWRHSDHLAGQYPAALVDPDVLYAVDGRVITSAGTAAGIDACLHLVRTELGTAVATRIARRMVVPPHRDGGQRQFIDRPVPATEADSLGPLLVWLLDHLDETHTSASLARRVSMSERTFARRFVAETGTTAHQWITGQRLARARELLEATSLGIDQVAARAGFGGAALLRHHFVAETGITPSAFRAQHRCPG